MALSSPSLFLYGFQVTEINRSLDFKNSSGGSQLNATLTLGYYSLTSLAVEVKKQLQAADPTNSYIVSINRNISGGTQNRVTIGTSGSYLSLLFGTGTRAGSSCAALLGYTGTDKTGATSYQGQASAGTSLITNFAGYNYIPKELMQKQFGSLNISTSGIKEAVVFATQRFWQVQFKYIPKTTAINEWSPLMRWLSNQRLFEFTPEITSPTIFNEGTLESSSADSKGLGYTLTEMLPSFPNLYDTGILKFRVKEQ